MSGTTHGGFESPRKHHEANPLQPRKIPGPNTAVIRSAELPLPDPAGDSSVGVMLSAEEQEPFDSKPGGPRPGFHEDTLRQRRVRSGKNSADGTSDGMRMAYNIMATASTSSAISTADHYRPQVGKIGSNEVARSTRHTLKSEPVHMPVDIKLPIPKTSPEVVEKIRRLSVLTAQAELLREEQEKHLRRAQSLRGQIDAGELACGRMIQQVLEIQEAIRQMTQRVLETQEAIEIRKRHMNEDERKISQEMLSRERKVEEMMSIVSQINVLAIETSSEASIGNI